MMAVQLNVHDTVTHWSHIHEDLFRLFLIEKMKSYATSLGQLGTIDLNPEQMQICIEAAKIGFNAGLPEKFQIGKVEQPHPNSRLLYFRASLKQQGARKI
jgi:hypothetical protein